MSIILIDVRHYSKFWYFENKEHEISTRYTRSGEQHTQEDIEKPLFRGAGSFEALTFHSGIRIIINPLKPSGYYMYHMI
jgi:hypothetical protein